MSVSFPAWHGDSLKKTQIRMTGAEKKNKTIQVRVLFTDGCPNASPVIDLIEKVANGHRYSGVVDRVLVASQENAVKLRCLGSPTIRINGLDIDPFTRGSVAFGLA
jgi:hypothetical protein